MNTASPESGGRGRAFSPLEVTHPQIRDRACVQRRPLEASRLERLSQSPFHDRREESRMKPALLRADEIRWMEPPGHGRSSWSIPRPRRRNISTSGSPRISREATPSRTRTPQRRMSFSFWKGRGVFDLDGAPHRIEPGAGNLRPAGRHPRPLQHGRSHSRAWLPRRLRETIRCDRRHVIAPAARMGEAIPWRDLT
jgi:hypothetical protein